MPLSNVEKERNDLVSNSESMNDFLSRLPTKLNNMKNTIKKEIIDSLSHDIIKQKQY